jgi:hypothetical protein
MADPIIPATWTLGGDTERAITIHHLRECEWHSSTIMPIQPRRLLVMG